MCNLDEKVLLSTNRQNQNITTSQSTYSVCHSSNKTPILMEGLKIDLRGVLSPLVFIIYITTVQNIFAVLSAGLKRKLKEKYQIINFQIELTKAVMKAALLCCL